MTQTSRTASARRLSPIRIPTGMPIIIASKRTAMTRNIVMATSVSTPPPAISPHNTRVVSIGPGKISGGSVRDINPQTISAATMESNLSMGPHLRDRRARKADARTRRAAARYLLGLYEESIFVDRQDPAIPHDDAPIDHGITDIAAACTVDKRFHRIEERREMRLSCFDGNQVGPLADLDGPDLRLSNCARTLCRRHSKRARRCKRAGIVRSGLRSRAGVFHALEKVLPAIGAGSVGCDSAGHPRRQEISDRRKPCTPEESRRRVEQDGGAACGQQLNLSRRNVRTRNGLNVRAQATNLVEQLDLPYLASEMARDPLVEFRRLGHVHVERKALFARDPARLTNPVLVHHPGQKWTDG